MEDAYTPILRKLAAEQVEKQEEEEQGKKLVKGFIPSGLSPGWRSTLKWASFVTVAYSVAQLFLPYVLSRDEAAVERLLQHVPMRVYQYSEAAFFTAAVLNFLSIFYEETQEKRQLALLSMLIKGLSWHCDYLIVTGRAVVIFDAYGALLLPSRYVQWACTTPTMLFTISKISNFTQRGVAITMAADFAMIAFGYIAAVLPPGFLSAMSFNASCVCFYMVLYNLYGMIRSAQAEANSQHATTALNITLYSSMAIWHLFPIGWSFARMGPYVEWLGEPLQLIANFGAKVVFSSCILYNNYVTLQQRRVQAQLEQEHRDRIIMVGDLKQSLQHKDEFISVIGHELRTPLNAVIKLSCAMSNNLGAPEYLSRHRLWIDTITRSAKHLLGIINDIITMKAARSGIHLKQELVYVGRVVDHVLRTLTPMAKREVVVEKIVAKTLPPIVADERRVIQVLSNVLGNALKFTERGKVCVRVRMDKQGHNVVIKIQDTGCGMPTEDIAGLLEPFRQVDMSSRRKYGGTGLGLSIANQLLKAHSGHLEIESTLGRGTTAVITLPVLQPETVDMLEAPFQKEYTAAGFSYEDLVSPAAAAAEGRRPISFVAPDGKYVVPHRGSSSGYGDRLPAVRGGARRSTEAPSGGIASGASGRRSVTKLSPANSTRSSMESANVEHYQGICSGQHSDAEGDCETAAGGGGGGPPPIAVALISSLYERTVPAVNTSAVQRVPPAQSSGARGTCPSGPASGDASAEAASPQGPKHQADAAAEYSSVACNEPLPQLPEMQDEGSDDGKPEWDEYQGTWHKPAKFNDGHDAEKEYYSYENRVSYEYRPSLDSGSGLAFWKAASSSVGGMSHSNSRKGLLRRSIDQMRMSFGSTGKGSGCVSETYSFGTGGGSSPTATLDMDQRASQFTGGMGPPGSTTTMGNRDAGSAPVPKQPPTTPKAPAPLPRAAAQGFGSMGNARNSELKEKFGIAASKPGTTGRTSWQASKKEGN